MKQAIQIIFGILLLILLVLQVKGASLFAGAVENSKTLAQISLYTDRLGNQWQAPKQKEREASASLPADTNLAHRYMQKARLFADSLVYDSAIAHYQKAATLYKEAQKWRDYIKAYNAIGNSFQEQGNYTVAEKHLQEAIAKVLEKLGAEDASLANSYHNMGIVYYYQGNYDQALEYYQKSLDIRLKVLGEVHPQVSGIYDNMGGVYFNKGNYDQALEYCQKSLSIELKLLGREHPSVAGTYSNIGLIYKTKGSYDQALEYQQKALSIQLKILGGEHPDIANSYNNIGITYRNKGSYDQALEYHQRALSIKLKILGGEHPSMATSYTSIGIIYQDKGNYDQALEYHQKALRIRLKVLGGEHPHVANSYGNMGSIYEAKANYNQALEYFQKALRIFLEVLGEEHSRVASIYFNIGIIYQDKGNYDQALEYHQKALRIRLKVLGGEHPDIANSYSSIGTTYRKKGSYDQALEYYQKALNIQLKALGGAHPDVADSYSKMAMPYKDQGQYKKALSYLQKAIMTLATGFEEENMAKNPVLEKISDEPQLLEVLHAKAQTLRQYYNEVSQNPDELRLSVATYERAIELIDKMKSRYKAEKTKLFLAEESRGIYRKAIGASLQLYQLTKEDSIRKFTFSFAEKSKAGVLREALRESEAKHFAGIPDSLLEQEQDLKIDLNYYEAAIQERKLSREPYDTAQLQDFENRFFDLNRQYEALLAHLEENYPGYYELKYDTHTLSVSQVQQKLPDPHTALLEYAFEDSSLAVFCITKNSFEAFRLPVALEVLEQDVQHFRKSILTSPIDSMQHSYQLYTQSAYTLYQHLLAPVLKTLPPEQITRLIIVPEGPLQHLPFEGLLRAPAADSMAHFQSLHYLLNDYSISYAYSATLFSREHKQKNQGNGRCLAFAPGYQNSEEQEATGIAHLLNRRGQLEHLRQSDLQHLPGAAREVKSLGRFFRGAFYTGTEATEQHFKEAVQPYSLVHLAMHGKADFDKPMNSSLFFANSEDSLQDNVLHAYEVYTLQLNAALAVLSGCETGLGREAAGEGLMSLSRAFSYAGCPSVVMSLWDINDKSTPELMTFFYEGLSKGLPKDEALRQAKLRFIKGANRITMHPYYWSAFITIGDPTPVSLHQPVPLWWWLAGGATVLFGSGLFLFKQYKKRRI